MPVTVKSICLSFCAIVSKGSSLGSCVRFEHQVIHCLPAPICCLLWQTKPNHLLIDLYCFLRQRDNLQQCSAHHLEIHPGEATTLWRPNGGSCEVHEETPSLRCRKCQTEFEELSTILAQIEACMNSHPLIPLSDDNDGIEVLTLGNFTLMTVGGTA